MTKQHFIALADSIRAHNSAQNNLGNIFDKCHIEALADFCQSTNPAFKRDRWLSYIAGECGKNGGVIKK